MHEVPFQLAILSEWYVLGQTFLALLTVPFAALIVTVAVVDTTLAAARVAYTGTAWHALPAVLIALRVRMAAASQAQPAHLAAVTPVLAGRAQGQSRSPLCRLDYCRSWRRYSALH